MERLSHTSRQHLCRLCSDINVEHLSRAGGYQHHATLKAWLDSAATCQLCSMLLLVTLKNPMAEFHPANNIHIDEDLKNEKFLQSHSIALRLVRVESSSTCDNVSLDLTSHFDVTKKLRGLCSVCVFTNEDDPAVASGLPWRRKLPEYTGSEDSYRVADSWLKACSRGHSDSGSSRSLKLDAEPQHTARRLIELSPTQVRVVDGKSVKEHYATLSYSWGPGDQWPWGPRRIAKSDLDTELKKGLSRDDLPLTIREAVDVAERLGFRHVWVDAMCILQNDPADWLFESKNMAAIYAEAQLNIAASGSPHKEAGLFNKRSRSQHQLSDRCVQVESTVHSVPSTLYFWREALDDEDRNSGGSESTDPDAFRDQIERGLLANRAWVCQERIASPRTLHYGELQLFWQCTHTMATEDNLGTRFPNFEDDTPWRSVFLPGRTQPNVAASDGDDDAEHWGIDEIRRFWYSFIIPKHYSSRKLTDQRDKLVAIAGLANKLKSHWESMRYLAGLWSGLELEGLLWSARGSGQRFDDEIGYVAPTWSWASRDGGTEYGEFCAANTLFDCKLLECQVETEDGSEFSRVKSATIKIEAAYLCGEAVSGQEIPELEHSTLRLDNGTITGRAVLDDDRIDHKEVSALLLRMDSFYTVFLLVTDHPEIPGEYIRVGIGNFRSWKFPNSFNRLERSEWVLR